MIQRSIQRAQEQGVPAKTYYDLSVSGQRTDYIINDEISKISALGNVRTIIADGGANDILEDCRPDSELKENVEYIGVDCGAAIDNMQRGVERMHAAFAEIESIENVVWVGAQYFPVTMVAQIVVDEANSRNRTICQSQSSYHCSFVDNSSAWTQANAKKYLISDKQHVTIEGAAIIGENIWNALSEVGAYF